MGADNTYGELNFNPSNNLKSFHKDLKEAKSFIIPANTLKVGSVIEFKMESQSNLVSTDNHFSGVCSECGKRLSDDNGSVVIYKPQSNGVTQLHAIGFQCSLDCYTKVMSKK